MAKQIREWTDQYVEEWIGNLLRAGVYLSRGYIDPGLAMPVMLGVVAGSMLGAHVLAYAKTRWLRLVFGLVIVVMAIEMIYHGLTGRL